MACPFCHKEHTYGFEEALTKLERGPSLVRDAVAGAGETEASFCEPKPGGWSANNVVGHLLDCEMVYSVRFRKLLAEDAPQLPAFDQDRWAGLGGAAALEEKLRALELLRRLNIALVRAAEPGAIDRKGHHAEYGALSVRDHILHLAEHDAKHAAQIRRVREAYTASAR